MKIYVCKMLSSLLYLQCRCHTHDSIALGPEKKCLKSNNSYSEAFSRYLAIKVQTNSYCHVHTTILHEYLHGYYIVLTDDSWRRKVLLAALPKFQTGIKKSIESQTSDGFHLT